MEKHIFLAFDLGATSGRSILGTVADGKVEIKELTRFPNAVTPAPTSVGACGGGSGSSGF